MLSFENIACELRVLRALHVRFAIFIVLDGPTRKHNHTPIPAPMAMRVICLLTYNYSHMHTYASN